MPISVTAQEGTKTGSWIRKMFEQGLALAEKYGPDKVCDLSIGNPYMEPPSAVAAELRELAESPEPGMHRYMPNAGYPETRAAMASLLATQTGVLFTGDDVVMTCGTAGALNCAFKALLDPGDEVITIAPYFFEYDAFAANFGAVIRIVASDDEFNPDCAALSDAITPRTKAVILNSPNNPTGKVYSDAVLERVARTLADKAQEYGIDIFAISDDVYARISFDGRPCPRMVNHYDDTIVVSSFSKDLSLPGERIGYAAVHPHCRLRKDVVGGIVFANRVMGFVSAPALQQRLVTRLFDVTVDVAHYQTKRDFLFDNLTALGYSIVKPGGAFYMFPRSPIADDVSFVNRLAEEMVLVVPGTSFAAPGYFRLSYCVDDATLRRSLDGFARAIAGHTR
ncbi:MAG: pyridoxal phosphate-dependent aminotransferase [Actinomycetia bacterium]|nr:pyridoxal phosphate-dependent aminotransferase [Actinomycetes bacterium]